MVRVTVMYQPIVPLVNLPSFPLSATTARTIIKSLPVGVAPTAASGCFSTVFSFDVQYNPNLTAPPEDLVVGQEYDWTISVNGTNNIPPSKGKITVTDVTDANNPMQVCQFGAPSGVCKLSFSTPGDWAFNVLYEPDLNEVPCYVGAFSEGEPIHVIRASTVTTITSANPTETYRWETFPVYFKVSTETPGSGVPTGIVTVSDDEGTSCSGSINVSGEGSCVMQSRGTIGEYQIYAQYQGDVSYNPSDLVYATHTVKADPPVVPPPDNCPSIIQGISSFDSKTIQLTVKAPDDLRNNNLNFDHIKSILANTAFGETKGNLLAW